MMQAYSPRTKTTYDSWEDLVAAEANGYAVIAILSSTAAKTGRVTTFARELGPFESKRLDRNRAATLRRQYRRDLASKPPGTSLLKVTIEPLWNEL